MNDDQLRNFIDEAIVAVAEDIDADINLEQRNLFIKNIRLNNATF